MAATVAEGKAEQILEVYQEAQDVSETAAKTNTKKEVVEDVVEGNWESPEEEESQEIDTDPEPQETAKAPRPRSTPFGPTDDPSSVGSDGEEEPDFATQTPGEFLDWFFSTASTGTKEDFENLMIQRARINDAIPDEQLLMNWMEKADSGLNNTKTIELIGEMYADFHDKWKEANYLQQGQQQPQGGGGGWTQSPDQPQQDMGGGSWTGRDQQPPGRPPQQQGNFQQPPQQQGNFQQPPQQQGQNQMLQMVQQMMERQQQQFQEMLQQQQQRSQEHPREDRSRGGPAEELRRLAEIRDAMEDLEDDGDEDLQRMAQMIGSEIQDMKEEIRTGNAPSPATDAMDTETRVISQLAQRDDVDSNVLTEVAQAVGSGNDPEVRKAEIEKNAELKKSENRKDMIEGVVEGLGENAGQMFGALFSAMGQQGGGGGQGGDGQPQRSRARQARPQNAQQAQPAQTQPAQAEPAQPAQAEPAQAEQEEVRKNEPQQATPVDESSGSTARQRIEELAEEDVSEEPSDSEADSPETDDKAFGEEGAVESPDLPVSPEEAAELYDTEDYTAFISQCSEDHGRDQCIDVWKSFPDEGGD